MKELPFPQITEFIGQYWRNRKEHVGGISSDIIPHNILSISSSERYICKYLSDDEIIRFHNIRDESQ
jgi:hypothetical protein